MLSNKKLIVCYTYSGNVRHASAEVFNVQLLKLEVSGGGGVINDGSAVVFSDCDLEKLLHAAVKSGLTRKSEMFSRGIDGTAICHGFGGHCK